MGRGPQRLGQSVNCGTMGDSEHTCAGIWSAIGSSMIHERIARVFVRAVHLRGVALVCAELEWLVAQGSFSCRQKDEMN